MLFRSWILRVLLSALLGGGLSATQPAEGGGRLVFSVLGPEQGFPTGMAMCMAQDTAGFLWFGTENGLYRYEGGQARRFTVRDGLPSGYIQDLLATTDGGLWVSTLRGLVRFRAGRFEAAQFSDAAARVEPFLITQDGKGRCWAGNNRGLFVQREGVHFDAAPLKPA